MPEWYKTENEYKPGPKIGMACMAALKICGYWQKTGEMGYRPLVDLARTATVWLHLVSQDKNGFIRKSNSWP